LGVRWTRHALACSLGVLNKFNKKKKTTNIGEWAAHYILKKLWKNGKYKKLRVMSVALPLRPSKVMKGGKKLSRRKLENKDRMKYLSKFWAHFNCIGLYMGMRLPLHIKKLWGNGMVWTSHPLVCKELWRNFFKKSNKQTWMHCTLHLRRLVRKWKNES